MSGIRKRRKTVLFAFLCVLCFVLDRYTLHLAAQTMAEEGVRLPVIMYHSLLKDPSQAGAYVLSPEVLARDLDWLQAHGYETVTVGTLIAYAEGTGELPEKPVMITFDDGHFNNYLYALPLLQERGMQAVISVIGIETERFTESGQENAYWSYLSAERLREMHESGVFEIQNHSYDLHALEPRRGCLRRTGEKEGDYRELLTADTGRAQRLLIEAGVPTPTCYTYPFGAYSAESEEILRELGFFCTLSCSEGINTITRDPDSLYLLKRYNRPSGISSGRFFEEILHQ
ncbi:MAG: polysaccharide deacetylase family protein [Butyricicoccus sp.]|nr:polysaccharide deacetylase family protein [Butyricicoccus sp.]MBQ8586439.1 polysaccharide deacetylase family protein [Butyricicoccus sp.]